MTPKNWRWWLGRPATLAFAMGLVLNAPVAWMRQAEFYGAHPQRWAFAGLELACVATLSWLILTAARLLGRSATRLIGSFLWMVSAVCAYYMIFFKVTIGHGILGAVFTLDHDLSGEVIGWQMLVFVTTIGLLPGYAWWRAHRHQTSWFRQTQPLRALGVAVLGVLMAWGAFKWTQIQLNAVAKVRKYNT